MLTGSLSVGESAWLADHVVDGVVLFPGAGFVELVLRAGDEVGCSVVEELTLLAPLVLPPGGGARVQVVVDRRGRVGVSRRVGVFPWRRRGFGVGRARPGLTGRGPAGTGDGFVGVAAGRVLGRRRR